jgi:hypothetical protein
MVGALGDAHVFAEESILLLALLQVPLLLL